MSVHVQQSGAVTTRVEIFDTAVAGLARSNGPVAGYTRGKANEVAGQARRIVPVRTGKLRSSIRTEQARELKGRYTVGYQVSADTAYAVYVHEGTRAHTIVPVNSSVLVFHVGGMTVFAKKVNHPGTRANPFLTRAMQVVIGRTR